jgi:hypothetical protein
VFGRVSPNQKISSLANLNVPNSLHSTRLDFVLVIRVSLMTLVDSITAFFDLQDIRRGQSLYRARDCQHP